MIKLFRRIRQNLLNEGKTSRYFKYATGEIILVVLGILIALQINAWYEGYKKNQLKQVYVDNLINDLSKDSLQLTSSIALNETDFLQQSDSLVAFINNPETDVFDIKAYAKVKGLGGLRTLNSYNTNTYTLLVSTGNIDLFNDSIIQEIMELNRLQKLEIEISNGNTDIYFNELNSYHHYYVRHANMQNHNMLDEIWKDIDAVKHAPAFINTALVQNHAITRYVNLTKEVLIKTENLLNTLKSQ